MIKNTELPDATQSLRKMICDRIKESGKTQAEIACLLGYDNPNVITMFKKGPTRLPLPKVVPFALSVGGDPARLLRMWFEAYEPDALPHIMEYLCHSVSPSRDAA